MPAPNHAVRPLWSRTMRPFISLAVAAATLLCLTSVSLVAPEGADAKPRRGTHVRTLKLGSHGPKVRQLQRRLHVRPADGAFGPKTARAVRRWQRGHGLRPTGVAGPATLRKLGLVRRSANAHADGDADAGLPAPPEVPGDQGEAAAAQTPPAAPRKKATPRRTGPPPAPTAPRSLGESDAILAEGARGEAVLGVQHDLNEAGFTTEVDGVFGAGTVAVVKAFERAKKLAVDGAVDPKEAAAIHEAAGYDDAGGPAASAGVRTVAGPKARLGRDGLAIAPSDAPQIVKDIIEAGNRIAKLPYRYGGGHGRWNDSGYDCSGSVSFALHGGGFLKQALVSGDFAHWGGDGPGKWITIYANGGHVYMVVAGLRFDTSGARQTGSRWQTEMRSGEGFAVTHPVGL